MTEATPAVSAFEILVGEPATFDSSASLLAAEGNIVRFIRGEKATTKADLFDEFAAALQFPFHFGHNWDALSDSLADLDWLGVAFGYYVVIWNADKFLAGDADSLQAFASIVQDANVTWTNSQRKPFKVVLQVSEGKAEQVKAAWSKLVGALPAAAHDTAWD
ncbi:MAG: barstar family protein [Segniliparus sp.]|uniref:barstar family protein n=1 Tax=Segniliparus sp. TaxID=2804064 RepID=UPI003F2A002E